MAIYRVSLQKRELRPTDDYSWQHAIVYDPSVIKLAARESLKQFTPEVVICSWPPASFEEQIFKTTNIQMYIVMCSHVQFAAGNWTAYKNQRNFTMELDKQLSSSVLPPELE